MDLSEVNAKNTVRHPWETARFSFFYAVLRNYLSLSKPQAYLDVGAGDAWFASQMQKRCSAKSYVCWDNGYKEDRALQNAHPELSFTTGRPTERFDVILLLDVLEHIEDDRSFLKTTVQDNLRDDGHVLISVPAWPSLFSDHDVRLRHYRRYRPDEIRDVIESSGLRIVATGGLFHSLLMGRLLMVWFQKITASDWSHDNLGDWNHGPLLTKALELAFRADAWTSLLAARFGWQTKGLSVWALCKK
jgi:SAM-dependent methyltransferase